MVSPHQPQEQQENRYDRNIDQQVNYNVSEPSKSNFQPGQGQLYPPPPQYATPSAPQLPQTMPAQHLEQPALGIPIANQFPGPVLVQVGPQPWRTGLFGCMEDPGNAIITVCCPCVTFGLISEVLDEGGSSCCSCALAYICITYWIGCPCILSCGYRTKLRNKFGLSESPAPDFLVHCFCEWCALCQEYRELNLRGLDPDLGWQGNLNRNNMMQQRPMEMMPPTNQTMNY